jgi:hypothetical protein
MIIKNARGALFELNETKCKIRRREDKLGEDFQILGMTRDE